MPWFKRRPSDRDEAAGTAPDIADATVQGMCVICGRDLWSDGLAPARDGDAWICGDCDQARNFQAEVEEGLLDD